MYISTHKIDILYIYICTRYHLAFIWQSNFQEAYISDAVQRTFPIQQIPFGNQHAISLFADGLQKDIFSDGNHP